MDIRAFGRQALHLQDPALRGQSVDMHVASPPKHTTTTTTMNNTRFYPADANIALIALISSVLFFIVAILINECVSAYKRRGTTGAIALPPKPGSSGPTMSEKAGYFDEERSTSPELDDEEYETDDEWTSSHGYAQAYSYDRMAGGL